METEIEAAVRRALAKQLRLLVPALGLAALLAAVLATPRQSTNVSTDTSRTFAEQSLDETAAPAAAPLSPGGEPSSAGTPTATGSNAAAVPARSGAPSAPPGAAGVEGPAGGNATRPAASGPESAAVSRTGVRCDGTNRQLPESSYGPLCVPAFTGDNGGATSYGVSADEIIVTYRIGDSANMAALEAAGAIADQRAHANDMEVFIDHFNERFELYGRRVKLVRFSGQGDILEEHQGRGQQGAQADAARAKDLGAFADVSYLAQTQPYAENLVTNQIVAFSPIHLTRNWHQTRAPFSHSPAWPSGEDAVEAQSHVICGSLHPGKAERSGDPLIATQDRVFGVLHPENPEYAGMGEILEQRIAACGATIGRRVAYPLDVTQAVATASNAMAQFRSAGVTTIICGCDPIGPSYFMEAANAQNYVPEWFLTVHWADTDYRLYAENQFRGQLINGGITERFLEGEPGAVFREASGGAEPGVPTLLDRTYEQILGLFIGLQAAGPNLTPITMYEGYQNVPDTLSGTLGPWEFGPGPAIPQRWFGLGVYDPDAISNLDGEVGASVACRGGRYFRFDDAANLGGPLDCPL